MVLWLLCVFRYDVTKYGINHYNKIVDMPDLYIMINGIRNILIKIY